MNILGIHDGHTAAAALSRQGKVVAAAQEERFTPEQTPVDAEDVQQALASFDAAAGFDAGAADVLARILRTEAGHMRTLLANVTLPANAPDALERLARTVEITRYLGVGGETLAQMLSNQYDDLLQASNAILGAFRAKYSDEAEWQAALSLRRGRSFEDPGATIKPFLFIFHISLIIFIVRSGQGEARAFLPLEFGILNILWMLAGTAAFRL